MGLERRRSFHWGRGASNTLSQKHQQAIFHEILHRLLTVKNNYETDSLLCTSVLTLTEDEVCCVLMFMFVYFYVLLYVISCYIYVKFMLCLYLCLCLNLCYAMLAKQTKSKAKDNNDANQTKTTL